jgi:hypothetical protein
MIDYLYFYRRGENENDENLAFLNEKSPALQDVVRRLPSILTDFKIKSVDLVVKQTHVKVGKFVNFFN